MNTHRTSQWIPPRLRVLLDETHLSFIGEAESSWLALIVDEGKPPPANESCLECPLFRLTGKSVVTVGSHARTVPRQDGAATILLSRQIRAHPVGVGPSAITANPPFLRKTQVERDRLHLALAVHQLPLIRPIPPNLQDHASPQRKHAFRQLKPVPISHNLSELTNQGHYRRDSAMFRQRMEHNRWNGPWCPFGDRLALRRLRNSFWSRHLGSQRKGCQSPRLASPFRLIMQYLICSK